jgi:hypothetical protein
MQRPTPTRLIAAAGLMALLAIPAVASAGKADHQVPIRGTFWGDEASFMGIPEGRCVEFADVADVLSSFSGEGIVTHLGRVTIEAEHCSDLDTGRYADGRFTITAANGDTLRGTYTSGVSLTGPPIIEFTDDVTFVDGGTGRFSHASGGGSERGVFNLVSNEWTFRMEGTVSYSR